MLHGNLSVQVELQMSEQWAMKLSSGRQANPGHLFGQQLAATGTSEVRTDAKSHVARKRHRPRSCRIAAHSVCLTDEAWAIW